MTRLLPLLYFVGSLCFGITLIAVTPIGQVADEVVHIIRADAITHGKFLGRKLPSPMYGTKVMQGGTFADSGLFWMAIDSLLQGHRLQTPENASRVREMGWSHRIELYETGGIGGYFPIFYLPAAAGLGTARLLGASPYNAVQIGRFANLLAFLAMGTTALWVARRGRAVLLWVLAAPMTLSLAASFNQDGQLIGAAVLGAALASRAWDAADTPDELPHTRWFWAAAAVIGLLALVKPPYLSLGVLLLLPLPADWRSRADREALWRRIGILALLSIPCLLWLTLAFPSATGSPMHQPYEAGPLWPGAHPTTFLGTDPAAQMRVLLAHPLQAVVLPVWEFFHSPALLLQAIGILGWLNIRFADWFYALWGAAFAAAVVAGVLTPRMFDARRHLRPADIAVVVLAVIATIWAIYLSQYVTWTDVGKASIDGVTGRYLLPLIPMLAVVLPRLAGPAGARVGRVLDLAPLLMLVLGGYVVQRALIAFFFIH